MVVGAERKDWGDWVGALQRSAARRARRDGAPWGHCCVRFCLETVRPGVLSFGDYVAGAILATEAAAATTPCVTAPPPTVQDQLGEDEEGDGEWGTTMATVAHALRWRYRKGSYVFRRIRERWERALRRGDPIPLPPAGYVLLIVHPDHAVVLDARGRLSSADREPEHWWVAAPDAVTRGDLVDPDDADPRHQRWEIFCLRPPSEREVARTAQGTPGGVARRTRWCALRRLVDAVDRDAAASDLTKETNNRPGR